MAQQSTEINDAASLLSHDFHNTIAQIYNIKIHLQIIYRSFCETVYDRKDVQGHLLREKACEGKQNNSISLHEST